MRGLFPDRRFDEVCCALGTFGRLGADCGVLSDVLQPAITTAPRAAGDDAELPSLVPSQLALCRSPAQGPGSGWPA